MKKLFLLFVFTIFTVLSFAQTGELFEREIGTKRGKYPLTVTSLKNAIASLDSGVVYIAYPGLWDTTGLGAIPSTVKLNGWLFGKTFLGGKVVTNEVIVQEKGYFIGGDLDIRVDNSSRSVTLYRNDLMKDISLAKWDSASNSYWIKFTENSYKGWNALPFQFPCYYDTGGFNFVLGVATISPLVFAGVDTVLAFFVLGSDNSNKSEVNMEGLRVSFGFFLTPPNDTKIGFFQFTVEP